MSAFLGPIHYWLYNKIQFQEKFMTALVTALVPEENRKAFLAELDSDCGRVEGGPLEEVIDGGNIHGWLQEQIAVSETRLAQGVARLLDQGFGTWENLENSAWEFGHGHPVTGVADAEEMFRELDNRLLDGMPCDRVNEIVVQGPGHLFWEQRVDLHQPYWDGAGRGPCDYKRLRGAWIQGMLADSGFSYSQENGRFSIKEV